MSSKGNQSLIGSHLKQLICLFIYLNINKISDKALVAVCIINWEKCKNKLTLIRGKPKLYDWISIQAYGAPNSCSPNWLSAGAGTLHMFSSMHQSTASKVCRTSPSASPSLQQRHGEAQGLQKLLAGSICTVLTKPKARGVPVLWYQSLPHWEPEQTQSSLCQAAWFQDASLGGLVKSLTVF